MLGGGVLLFMGIKMLRSFRFLTIESEKVSHPAFLAGILTSILNPYFILWWATVGMVLLSKSFPFGLFGLLWLIGLHWSCDAGWLFLLSSLIYAEKRKWREDKILVSGLILIFSVFTSQSPPSSPLS